MLMCHPDLKQIYFIAVGDHTNPSLDTLFHVQSLLVSEILVEAVFLADRQGSNFESCVWKAVSSYSSDHPPSGDSPGPA